LLLAAESSDDVATVFSEAFAQQVAVAGECTSCGDLRALVTEVVALDLDVVAAHSTRTSEEVRLEPMPDEALPATAAAISSKSSGPGCTSRTRSHGGGTRAFTKAPGRAAPLDGVGIYGLLVGGGRGEQGAEGEILREARDATRRAASA
jgi:hypothetical protein